MNSDLNIDLSGIPDARWAERAELCADCRKSFEVMREEDPESGDDVPLLLWRNNATEMLKLCWPCATKRMSASDVMTGTE